MGPAEIREKAMLLLGILDVLDVFNIHTYNIYIYYIHMYIYITFSVIYGASLKIEI